MNKNDNDDEDINTFDLYSDLNDHAIEIKASTSIALTTTSKMMKSTGSSSTHHHNSAINNTGSMQSQSQQSQQMITKLQIEINKLKQENETLKRNMGILYRTAKLELERKDARILQLENSNSNC